MGENFKVIIPEKSRASYDRFHFSPATWVDGVLFCSGIIGTGESGKIPENIEEEFRNAWQSVEKLLLEAGMSLSHIVEYTSYHVGLQNHMREFMLVRDQFLSEPWPAWTAIGITELAIPGAHVEIRVTAVNQS